MIWLTGFLVLVGFGFAQFRLYKSENHYKKEGLVEDWLGGGDDRRSRKMKYLRRIFGVIKELTQILSPDPCIAVKGKNLGSKVH